MENYNHNKIIKLGKRLAKILVGLSLFLLIVCVNLCPALFSRENIFCSFSPADDGDFWETPEHSDILMGAFIKNM